jgi:WD40 repeat protein
VARSLLGKSVPSAPAAEDVSSEPEGPPLDPGRLDAFISYRRIQPDVGFVDTLQRRLAQYEKHIWVDRTKIEPASDWRDRISRGIESAKALIFVVTPESVSSEECRRELDMAVELHKLVIPIVLRGDFDNNALPEQLSRANWVDFRNDDDFEDALSKLVQALEGDLEWRDAHARLMVRANEWADAGNDRSFLLRGNDLRAGEEWAQGAAEHSKTPPTALQIEYIQASRKGSDRAARTWRVALSVGLIVSLGLGGLALTKEIQATHEARVAESNALSAEATVDLSSNPQESIDLALRSTRLEANASTEQALRLALAEARLRMVIRSNAGPATVAALGPTGGEIAVAAKGSVELWDANTGRLLQALPMPAQYAVSQLLFDPSGTNLAAISAAGYVSLWHLLPSGTVHTTNTEQLNSYLHAHSPRSGGNGVTGFFDVWSSSSAPNRWWPGGPEELGVYGAPLPDLVMVNPGSGTMAWIHPTTPGNALSFADLAVSPDGSELFADGTTIDFATDTESRLNSRFFNGDYSTIPGGACWYPDGDFIATMISPSAVNPDFSSGGPVEIWNAKTGGPMAEVETPGGATALGCNPNAAYPWVAAGDEYGNVELSTTAGFKQLYASDGISDIVSSADGQYMATASVDGTARIWNTGTGLLVAVLSGDGSALRVVQFDANGGLALTIDSAGMVRLWDTDLGTPLTQLSGPPQDEAVALGFTGGGALVWGVGYRPGPLTGLSGPLLLLWDTGTGRLADQVPLPGIVPSAVPCSWFLQEVSELAKMEVLSSQPDSCDIPPPPNLVAAVPVPGPDKKAEYVETLALQVSADGKYLAYAGARAVAVMDLVNHHVTRLEVDGPVSGLSFGPSDRALVMTEKAVYLWEPFSSRRLVRITQPSAPIDAELSANGARLATANVGGTISVWDTGIGQLVTTFRPEPSRLLPPGQNPVGPLRVALNARGTVVASGDADGDVFVWDIRVHPRVAGYVAETDPVVELEPASGGSRFLAVDYPQAGQWGSVAPKGGLSFLGFYLRSPGAGAGVVLDAARGRDIAAYTTPLITNAPVNPGAALSPNGSFLLAGALGLAPSPPGGVEAVYQVSSGEVMASLDAATQATAALWYESSPAQPWSPAGNDVLIGNAIYACDACGSLHQMQMDAAARLAWAQPLSATDDHPPSTDPYS